MHVQKSIVERRTVHKYQVGSIPEGILMQALEGALMAPCHKLTFAMRFYRLGSQTRQRILDATAEALAQKNGAPISESHRQKLEGKLLNPGEIIAFTQVKCDDAFRAKEDYATLACAIQNFSLSLWAEGFGTKWSTGSLTRAPSTYEILGIDPEAEEIVGFVSAGIPQTTPSAPNRPSLSDILVPLD